MTRSSRSTTRNGKTSGPTRRAASEMKRLPRSKPNRRKLTPPQPSGRWTCASPRRMPPGKTLMASQEKERLALKAEHRKESSLLARQQVADRLAVEEKLRAQTLDKKSQRVSSGLSSRQDMATAQRAAVETMKLHARTNWVAGIVHPPDSISRWIKLGGNVIARLAPHLPPSPLPEAIELSRLIRKGRAPQGYCRGGPQISRASRQ